MLTICAFPVVVSFILRGLRGMLTTNLKFSGSAYDTALRAYRADAEGATARYQDEKDLEPGDTIAMCRESGRKFGHAEVTATEQATVKTVIETIEERREYRQVVYSTDDDMKVYGMLVGHYGNEIDPLSDVKVVFYKPTLVLKSALDQ